MWWWRVDAEILATIEKFVQYGVQPEWMQIQTIINSKVQLVVLNLMLRSGVNAHS